MKGGRTAVAWLEVSGLQREHRASGANTGTPTKPTNISHGFRGTLRETVQAVLDADCDGPSGDLSSASVGALHDRIAQPFEVPGGDDKRPHAQQDLATHRGVG